MNQASILPATNLDLSLAEDLLSMCLLTYSDLNIGEQVQIYEVVDQFHDEATGTDGYIWFDGGHAIVCFRGTEKNGEDIFTDLKFRFKINEDGEAVHRGFLQAWRSVQDDVEHAITSISARRVTFTGHSLGGALATVAWNEKWVMRRRVDAYTFGAPRVGGSNFGAETHYPLFRFVYRSDLVPALPFVTLGYRHVGDMVYLDGESVELNPSFYRQLKRCSDALTPGSHQWSHHKIARYAQGIENAIENMATGMAA